MNSRNSLFFSLLMLFLPLASPAQSSADILKRLIKLRNPNTVLFIAAHPDDENTRLITWLSKEKGFRTAYLSLTRGDGGQNLIGSELGVELGLIRTRELIAARSLDGGEQFFTSAYDFGYSKSTDETLRFWDEEKVLEDMVYVIRKIRPDVIICRFPPDKRAGHGHHSASAYLAAEAFRRAGDPSAFHWQLPALGTWKPERIYWNTYNFGSGNTTSESQFQIDAGGYDPLSGMSNGEVAALSRSQHKSQGFGVPAQRGMQKEYFLAVDGDSACKDVFNDVIDHWAHFPRGKTVAASLDKVIRNFDLLRPSESIDALLKVRSQIQQLPSDQFTHRKLAELDDILPDLAGFWCAAYAFSEKYVAGDTVHVSIQAISRLSDSLSLSIDTIGNGVPTCTIALPVQKLQNRKVVLKSGTEITQPYWLKVLPSGGMFSLSDSTLRADPWNAPALSITGQLGLNGVDIPINIPVTFKLTDPVKGELIQPLVLSPLITGSLSETVSVFHQTDKRTYKLKIGFQGSTPDTVQIILNDYDKSSWSVSFRDTLIYFKEKGEEQELQFQVAPLRMEQNNTFLSFSYRESGNSNAEVLTGFREISYDHIPKISWFPELKVRLQAVPMKVPFKRVLYIRGAGDFIPETMRQLGWKVDEKEASEIDSISISQYDAVITGIRAYNTDKRLPYLYGKLMDYVQNGGCFVVQYNTNSNLHPSKIMAPFPFSITRNRVTEEDAEVRFLSPSHPLLNAPNRITTADFDGWVQERGLYFAGKIDSSYTDVISMNDAGEEPSGGSLICAGWGKGKYIYTGLSFFRQLPAGVPGAWKLFVNLFGE